MCKQLLLHTARFTLIYELVLLKREKKKHFSQVPQWIIKKLLKWKKILIKNFVSNY